jgi:zinc/manganese transport system permease protein
LVADCVDPTFLRIAGGHGGFYHGVFLGLVVLNLVAGFAAIGTLLAVGLMIIPAVIGRLLGEDLTGMIAISVGAALAACLAGILTSYHLGLPTGPAIILCGGAIYLASLIGVTLAALTRRYWPTRHLEA